ncbi:MAG: type II secretion system protein GspM [Solirubrobacteraceae bacterium]
MTLRPRDRVVLAVVGVLAVLGAFYLLALKPERQQAGALQAQIITQQQALSAAQQSYNVGRAARASLKSDGPEWAALKLAVPEQSDIPALLRTLEKNAKSVHVSMQAITLSGAGTSSAAASAPAPATTGTGTAATAPAATPVPIQLTFGGGYVALNKLVRKLTGLVQVSGGKVHAMGPLLSINSVALTGTKSLTGQLTATIYQLAAPAGATTGGQG